MVLLVLLIAAPSSRAACPADTGTLRADVQVAAKAYDDWAWEEFDRALAAVRADLGCLTEVVPSSDVEPVYRLFALAGARQQDAGLAEAAFRGALVLEPGYEPDPALAPQGSLLRRAWDQARAAGPGAVQPLPAGTWFVDGRPRSTELPTERVALVQFQGSGAVLSWYLDGGALPPDLWARLAPQIPEPAAPVPALVAAPPADLPARPVPARGGHPSRALLISGLAAAAVGAGGLVVGESCQATMMAATEEAQAEKYYHYGLASTFGGWALAAAGGGLVVGAVVKGRW
jgi:hypothetical protein